MGLLHRTSDDDEAPAPRGLATEVHLATEPLQTELAARVDGGVRVEHKGHAAVEHKGAVTHHHSGGAGVDLRGGAQLHHAGTAGVDLKGTARVHMEGAAGVEVGGKLHTQHGGGIDLGGKAAVELGGATEIHLGGASALELGTPAGKPLAAELRLTLGDAIKLGPIALELGRVQVAPDLELKVKLFGRFTLLSLSLRGRTRVGPES